VGRYNINKNPAAPNYPEGYGVADEDYVTEFMRDHASGLHDPESPMANDMDLGRVKWDVLREEEKQHYLDRYKEAMEGNRYGEMSFFRAQIPEDVFAVHFGDDSKLAGVGSMAGDIKKDMDY